MQWLYMGKWMAVKIIIFIIFIIFTFIISVVSSSDTLHAMVECEVRGMRYLQEKNMGIKHHLCIDYNKKCAYEIQWRGGSLYFSRCIDISNMIKNKTSN